MSVVVGWLRSTGGVAVSPTDPGRVQGNLCREEQTLLEHGMTRVQKSQVTTLLPRLTYIDSDREKEDKKRVG